MAAAALQLAPEAIKVAQQRREQVNAIAHAAGLTADEDYLGWYAIAIIFYSEFWQPIKTLYHLEQQAAGVLDQLYKWLGGAGSALEGGVKSITAAVSGAVSTLERWI